ncbi:TMEM175 family protein [Herbaspirillum rhizosphaerae]|uniref:TMEM175 family protein n=1 Tax=Herbaspirillum rhizosphaerae TaxID=346179 RepID=UPI00067C9DF4|nr:TMEM175 family protein [Herbaspirillum rhizosphaerae]
MNKARLEAFSDGVIAIAITIMVLGLQMPHGAGLADLLKLVPQLLSYVLSFTYVGIYWVNHHHLLQPVSRVNGRILWANLHLLFWLSLIPFVTNWVAEHHRDPVPVASYGAVLLMCSVAFLLLRRALIASEGSDSRLAKTAGKGLKNCASIVLYGLAIPLSVWSPLSGTVIYVVLAALWFIPDHRFESAPSRQP